MGEELFAKLGGAGIAAGAGYLGMEAGQSALSDLQTQATQQIQGVREGIAGAGEFKPFAVTSGAGSVSYDAQGNPTYGQTAQQIALQNQATGLLGNVGQGVAGLGGTGVNAFNQSNLAMNANSGGFASGLGGAYAAMGEGQINNAGAPQNLSNLQSQFANQGMVGQAGSLGSLTGALQGQAANALGQRATDVTGAFSGIQAPNVSTASGNLAQQALSQADLGATGQNVSGLFSGVQAPNVRTGAGDAASQYLAAGGQALSQGSPTAQSVYDQMRAMQSPEEERRAIELENRLFAQGRGGVQTAAYGGTPEQLAMAKANAEARNTASLQAMTTADQLASSQQNRAQQLTQMGLSAEQAQAQMESEGFSQQMQLGQSGLQSAQLQSQLDTEAQGRQAQLAQLGLSADQIQQQMLSEGFNQQMSLAGSQLQTAQTQEALQASTQQRAAQLAQLGMSAEQIDSQLASEGLNRQQSSAQLAGQLAQTGAGISAQQQQLGQGMLGLGLQAQQLGGTLNTQDAQRAATMFGIGQQASALPSSIDAQNIQNMSGLFGASDAQTQQLLAQNAQALQAAQLGQSGSLAEMNALANLGVSELGMLQELGLGGASLTQEYIKSLGNIGAGVAGISLKP